MLHSFSTRFLPLIAVLLLAPVLAQEKPVPAADTIAQKFPAETSFWTQNSAAMDRMMAAMDIKPTGDVDADFAAMMIPHHQGAIDMAILQLRYGTKEQLSRIAQEINDDQRQEIAAMNLALGKPLPPSDPAPTGVSFAPSSSANAPGDSSVPSAMSSSMSHDGMSHDGMSPMMNMNKMK